MVPKISNYMIYHDEMLEFLTRKARKVSKLKIRTIEKIWNLQILSSDFILGVLLIGTKICFTI